MTYEQIKKQAEEAIKELLEKTHLKAGDIFVVGCSSSEIKGESIGRGSDINAAEAVYEAIYPALQERGIYIVEREALRGNEEIVNVVPQLHAGGSFSVTCYKNFKDPVAVEYIKADAGMDIGDTLIGMHLRAVAVPVRISVKQIGEAHLVCARTRPKFIGGERAVYDEYLSGGDIPR